MAYGMTDAELLEAARLRNASLTSADVSVSNDVRDPYGMYMQDQATEGAIADQRVAAEADWRAGMRDRVSTAEAELATTEQSLKSNLVKQTLKSGLEGASAFLSTPEARYKVANAKAARLGGRIEGLEGRIAAGGEPGWGGEGNLGTLERRLGRLESRRTATGRDIGRMEDFYGFEPEPMSSPGGGDLVARPVSPEPLVGDPGGLYTNPGALYGASVYGKKG